jgi:hypothetical protein
MVGEKRAYASQVSVVPTTLGHVAILLLLDSEKQTERLRNLKGQFGGHCIGATKWRVDALLCQGNVVA